MKAHHTKESRALNAIAREAIERGIEVDKKTFENVERLLVLMPVYKIGTPSLSLEADGGILLEWYTPSVSARIVSVIVDGERAVFAYLGADNQRAGGAVFLPKGGMFFVLHWVLMKL